jgi:hypothetical protein
LKSYFSPLISSKPLSPQEPEHRKKEREKVEEKVFKKERKKAQRVSSNKRGSQYFEKKNTTTSKIHFYMILFSPPPSYHFKNLFQIIERNFLTLFGPSFSLAIYMTSVVPFSFTHELHIFSL